MYLATSAFLPVELDLPSSGCPYGWHLFLPAGTCAEEDGLTDAVSVLGDLPSDTWWCQQTCL